MQSAFQYGELPRSGRYPRYNICTPDPVFWRYCHCESMAGYIDEVPQASVTRSSNLYGKCVQRCQCCCFSMSLPIVRATLSRKATHCNSEIETANHRSSPSKQISQISFREYTSVQVTVLGRLSIRFPLNLCYPLKPGVSTIGSILHP